MVYLPDEVLYMICTQLWHQGDFQTLFRCACSGKRLAPIAITNLYRMQAVSPITKKCLSDEDIINDTDSESESDVITNNGSDEDGSDEEISAPCRCLYRPNRIIKKIPSQKKLISMKCTSLWRAIVLSSLGKTLYPYSQYIRTLNLRDLEELIIQSDVRAIISNDLFQGEHPEGFLGNFQDGLEPQSKIDKTKAADRRHPLDSAENASIIGEAITKKTPLLEELSGNISSETLFRWIPRLPRLTHLDVWYSAATKDNGTLVRLHCPSFKRLHIRNSYLDGGESSKRRAAFLNELRPQSLESFKTSTYQSPGPEILHALSCHGESLVELKLNVIPVCMRGPIPQFSLLKGCTNLVSLSLAGTEQYTSLEKSHIDAFLEMVAWLKECKKLRILALKKFFTSPVIAPFFLDETIHLTSLEYEVYGNRDITEIHQALANQTSLQRLWFKVCANNDVHVVDGLVESSSKLVNLTDLRLTATSSALLDRHIVQLARSLTKLAVWSTCGGRLTDAIWGEVSTLRSLRVLDIYASTSFTTNGIVGFIEKLGPGNKGLALSVVQAERRSDLLGTEQELIQETIAKKAQGSFEFHTTDDYQLEYVRL
ncbi:hypothetical protein MMC29_001861 [Sticta canariensis]|nr:hypothetical protein [Sticta canariensis]